MVFDQDQRLRKLPEFDEVNRQIGIPDDKLCVLKMPQEQTEYFLMEWHKDWKPPNMYMALTTGYNVLQRKNARECIYVVDTEMSARHEKMRQEYEEEKDDLDELKKKFKELEKEHKKEKDRKNALAKKLREQGRSSGSSEDPEISDSDWANCYAAKITQEKPEMPKRDPPRS